MLIHQLFDVIASKFADNEDVKNSYYDLLRHSIMDNHVHGKESVDSALNRLKNQKKDDEELYHMLMLLADISNEEDDTETTEGAESREVTEDSAIASYFRLVQAKPKWDNLDKFAKELQTDKTVRKSVRDTVEDIVAKYDVLCHFLELFRDDIERARDALLL